MEVWNNTVNKKCKRCLFFFFFFYVGNIFLLFDSQSQGLVFDLNEWKVSEGCSWTQAFQSVSLYLQAKQPLPLCVWMSTHTQHTHVAPAASQRDEDSRFFYFLWTLNAPSWLPQIHSCTVTPTHSTAKQRSSVVSHECAPGRWNQWCFDTNICSRLGNGACRSLRGSCVLCRKQRVCSYQLFSV